MLSKLDFTFKTNQAIVKKISFIEAFRGKWYGLSRIQSKYLKELKRSATIESISSSMRLEGSTHTDLEVARLLGDIKVSQFKSAIEQQVYGYYEALNLVSESPADIALSERNLHHLHKVLLGKSEKDQHHRGKYKTLGNKVVAVHADGRKKTILNTTEPPLVVKEMKQLLKWTTAALNSKEIHPLLISGAFIYEFLSIHPYQDGNGRLSRLLTVLLLLQNGYNFMQYASIETELEKHKNDYYNALMNGHKYRYSEQEKIDVWLLFFLNMIEHSIVKLEQRYASVRSKRGYLSARQTEVLGFIREAEPVKIADLISALPAYTQYTLKKDVKYLVDEGLIERIGQARASVYILRSENTA